MEASCSRFTPAEGGARLAMTASEKNILAVENGTFIATRLVHEEAYKVRGSLSDGRQRSVYVTRASRVPCVAYELHIMTDLAIAKAVTYSDVYDWCAEMETKEVLVCTSLVLRQILVDEVLTMLNINVLIIDSCHLIWRDDNLRHIMQLYKECQEDRKPRILSIMYPLFTSTKKETDCKEVANLEEQGNHSLGREYALTEEQAADKESKYATIKEHEGVNAEMDVACEDKDGGGAEQAIQNNVKIKNDDSPQVGAYENLDDYDMYEKLEWKIEELERELCCEMDLAEDVDGGKRMSASLVKPKELIIEHDKCPSPDALSEQYKELDKYMRDTVNEAIEFIDDHRYDPTEIYGEELYEEYKSIPYPTIEPKYIFKQFLYVLDQLGPYAADKAAFSLLAKVEKLKIKVPYERHFLLFCLCTTVFVKIRCHADQVFSGYESDWEKIKRFCTPKVLRFADILLKFQPPELQRELSAKMMSDLEKCDFESLGNKIEDKVNAYEANLRDLDDFTPLANDDNLKNQLGNPENKADNPESVASDRLGSTNDVDSVENASGDSETRRVANNADSLTNNVDNLTNNVDRLVGSSDVSKNCDVATMKTDNVKFGFSRRSGGRNRGRGRPQRGNATRSQQAQQNPDALCGIVFMKEALMAKIMFMLIVDMSRSHPRLSYLCAQYCAVDSPADPGTEPKECQRQGKKQEEVLKKFRMHECNLLLTTSALEEGIDLPRCNLVLRWDVPASYRSYGLCRARARAARASCVIMCCADDAVTDGLVHNLATYKELDQIISRKCGCGIQFEPPDSEENSADIYTLVIKPYTPQEATAKPALNLHTHDSKSNDTANVHREVARNARDTEIILQEAKAALNLNRQDSKPNDTAKAVRSVDSNISNTVNDTDVEIMKLKSDNGVAFDNVEIDQKRLSPRNGTVLNKDSSNFKVDDDVRAQRNSVGDNLVCNRCNKVKNSGDVECECVSASAPNAPGNKVEIGRENDNRACDSDLASVDLSTAIALINRYCGKLPSDTFTRLAPQWWMERVHLPVRGAQQTRAAYVCTLRMPLNCPVKYNIVGHPMPTRVLARRMVALQACRILHKSGELDNQLMPIGKENFKAAELESVVYNPTDSAEANDTARPGTTKRRQYYYKRTAWVFTDCQPIMDTSDSELESKSIPKAISPAPTKDATGPKRNMLYAIVSKLWCALPERYNTRGRRLHAPQNANQAIGILMARQSSDDLQIPAFPVYTRSGEVRVSLEHVPGADVRVSPRRGRLVRRFMRFVFSEVLRVRRRGMKLQSEGSTHNNYYIVPTIKTTKEDGTTRIDIDWSFLELIYEHTERKKRCEVEKPTLWQEDDDEEPVEKVEKTKDRDGKVKILESPLLEPGQTFLFDAERYREAVVTPWYRNQDQPQYFLVAEICWNLTPESAFPSSSHATFREYYLTKYGASLTQPQQPLLDVDHTSARLNLLTPRYVNRKGVALPVSSERTRRAKRDRLDQKQILVPELCTVHPFAAPLWFATVALPCVLYRINALLIADEIRRAVAIDVGLGVASIDEETCPGFKWPPLDFGWSLAEVLNADTDKTDKKKEDETKEDKEKSNGQKEDQETKEKEDSQKPDDSPKEKTINDILQEKENAESGFEIGTWSNDMASSIQDSSDFDEYMEPLPSNLTFCTSASGGTNWCDPVEKPKSQFNPSRAFSMADSDCSYMSSDFDTDDSDLNTESDDETDSSGFWSRGSMGVRIEYKTAHEAEAVDVERKKVNPAPQPDEEDDEMDRLVHQRCIREGKAPSEYVERFRASVIEHKEEIRHNGSLIVKDKPLTDLLPEIKDHRPHSQPSIDNGVLDELFPFHDADLRTVDGQITLESIEVNKRVLLAKLKKQLSNEEVKKMNCFSMVDVDIDCSNYVNEKIANVGFDSKESYVDKVNDWSGAREYKPYYQDGRGHGKEFDFDYQPPLNGHPGPSPSVILQALTMSNANDGINLERLETIGDSFLKFAITAYLYCAHPTVHEGKLSHMRSKQVSNLNLYRLGRSRRLGARMVASKFEPHDNWLPPCHRPPHARATIDKDEKPEHFTHKLDLPVDSTGCFIPYNLITQHSIPDKSIADCVEALIGAYLLECGPRGALLFMSWLGIRVLPRHDVPLPKNHPYVVAEENREETKTDRLTTEPPNVPKPAYDSESSSEEAEAAEGPPEEPARLPSAWAWPARAVGSLRPKRDGDEWVQTIFGELKAPPSPLLRYIEDPEGELEQMLSGYDALERTLQYRFKDRSLLLQALTHASHQKNRLSDCYQRLEFLGDAVLDYLITRHLYEDPRRHSPGALTDLRSALVNNTIFATLAARHGFHKYFRHMSPGLNEVLTKYVKIQEENGHSISEEHYLIQEDEMEQAEDVEVPKALGDLFESVAGAIFLDSGMSLGAVWRSYVNLMGAELEAFSAAAPKSPVRELLEAEPDTAKFGKPERLADGRRVRVCVEVFGRGSFKGVGRNYRIAKGTAARCALRHLRGHKQR